MSKAKILTMALLVIGLSLGLTNMASAASAGCGQCHGTAPVSSSAAEQATGHRTGYESTPVYEDQKTPVAEDICNNAGRGLHGIHMNYSSASYGRSAGKTTMGTCNYCHNKHLHENGFVEFSGISAGASANVRITSAGKLSASGTGIDSRGLDITTMNGSATCAVACHGGTSATNTATWGNYTTSSVKLSCTSCHADSSNVDPAKVDLTAGGMSVGHSLHIVKLGGTNAACHYCHPDNTAEGKTTKDDGTKAYPHASDGTNVSSANAEIGTSNALKQFSFNSGTLTCSGVQCHVGDQVWTNAIVANSNGCASCHKYPGAVAGQGDWSGSNGHMARATSFQDVTTPVIRVSLKHLNKATAYTVNDDYATVTGDDRKCGKCHKNGTHMSGTVDVADNSLRGACSSTSFSYANISSNPANRIANCSNVSCHFGKTTPNWF